MNKRISRNNRLGRRPQPNLQSHSPLRPYGTSETKKRSFSILLSFLLTWVVLIASAQAGQVVTDEVRLWAKEAIAKEKALEAISAPNTVAVLYFHNRTGWSDLDLLQKGLTLMLITDLSKIKEIQLVERVKVQALAEELGLGVSGLVGLDTTPRVGKLLGVAHVIGGDILKGMIDDFQLKSNMLNVPVAEIYGQVSAEGKLLAELFRMEKDLLFEIINRLKIELTPELESELKKPLTTSIDAFRRLLQGLEDSDRGNYERAAASYQNSLRKDPNFTLAADFLQELQGLQLWAGPIEDDSKVEAYAEPADVTPEVTPGERAEDRDPTEREVNLVDTDGDGVPDVYDACPNDSNKTDPGSCGCGVTDTDSDRDGVLDCRDLCSNDPNKTDPGSCGCGVADTDSDGDGVPDCRDLCSNDPNKTDPGICGCGVPEGCYTQGDYPPIVDESSLAEAQDIIANDDTLRARVNDGEFRPGDLNYAEPSGENPQWEYEWTGAYEPGLQTLGIDEKTGQPTVLLNPDTLAKINSDPFLAYAVQVEEDRLNRTILEMHQAAYEQELIGTLMANINTALGYAEIRSRDDWFTQQADAQAGRVLKDRNGHWVRVQQYILRPDNKTVQVLNVSLRGTGPGAGLSTIDWTTTFTGDGYPMSNDLMALPWNSWLSTYTDEGGGRYVGSNINDPELERMYVKFTNPANESLKEQRGFGARVGGEVQYINDERLTINGSSYVYNGFGTLQDGQYQVVRTAGTGSNPSGFKYVFRPEGHNEQDINVAFFVVGDANRADNVGVMAGEASFDDIWDALRVNRQEGAPYIGNNNLEIAIDAETNVFNRPIDVVYIPMSRMLWKWKP